MYQHVVVFSWKMGKRILRLIHPVPDVSARCRFFLEKWNTNEWGHFLVKPAILGLGRIRCETYILPDTSGAGCISLRGLYIVARPDTYGDAGHIGFYSQIHPVPDVSARCRFSWKNERNVSCA